jgi:hypothetical protein
VAPSSYCRIPTVRPLRTTRTMESNSPRRRRHDRSARTGDAPPDTVRHSNRDEPDPRCPMPDARCPMPDARCPMPDARCPDRRLQPSGVDLGCSVRSQTVQHSTRRHSRAPSEGSGLPAALTHSR